MKIVAMVQFNSKWAYVFDTPINFRYREETHGGHRYLIGRDGPFTDCLAYQQDSWAKAFAGREFSLPMEDGTERKIKDVWWQASCPFPTTHITFSTPEQLRKCYVFSGCECDPVALHALQAEYEGRKGPPPYHPIAGGFRYEYWEYEKLLKHDEKLRKLSKEITKLEKTRNSLIAEARRQAKRGSQ